MVPPPLGLSSQPLRIILHTRRRFRPHIQYLLKGEASLGRRRYFIMTALADLPSELLVHILHLLAAQDLTTVLIAQRTSRRIHALIQDIISTLNKTSQNANWPLQVHPLLTGAFYPLFHSAAAFSPAERCSRRFLTLDGDFTLPFRRLP
ncbi:hypothetical protein F5Y15DRAFT_390669 [Xylariaceae sp. FL0016]|nr:hypothetical protein F5Y15DRAFT_390669 [Xylariaceae sp. FL0016]